MATSTSPGASPTKMIWASLFPEPGTGQNACPAQRRVQCVQSQRACHSDIRRGGRGFTLRLRCMVLSLYVYKVTWHSHSTILVDEGVRTGLFWLVGDVTHLVPLDGIIKNETFLFKQY